METGANFYLKENTNDKIPTEATIKFNDNIEWDSEMIEAAREFLAEHYDVYKDRVVHLDSELSKLKDL